MAPMRMAAVRMAAVRPPAQAVVGMTAVQYLSPAAGSKPLGRKEARPAHARLSRRWGGHLRSEAVVLEFDLNVTAREALDECFRRGLVVRSERELAGRTGSRHWHLGFPDRTGTLELNEWQRPVWVKVHPRRDGGWATALAHELSRRASADAPA